MTRISDRALVRWAWVALAVYVAAAVLDRTLLLIEPAPAATDWSSGTAGELLFDVAIGAFPVVGLLIIRRQPRNRIAWLLVAVGLAAAFASFTGAWTWYALVVQPEASLAGPLAQALDAASWVPVIGLLGTYLILLFPDGRLPSPRWRPFAWLCGVVIATLTLGIALYPGPVLDGARPTLDNPIGIESLKPVLDALSFLFLLLPACIIVSAAALVWRFRGAHGVRRLQLKWLATAGAAVAVTYLIAMAASLPQILSDTQQVSADWVLALQSVALFSFALIPMAIGVAISRHGLYGIDAIISRALVFGTLAVFITGVYVGIVVGVGALVGQHRPSVALSVLATAVVAVAFQPVRSRVERLANRLVYGERATPYEVLSDFAGRMTGTYPTGELLPRMAQMVGRCLGGARVEVWLVDGPVLAREVAWPDAARHVDMMPLGETATPPCDRQVEVRHHDELLGVLTVTKPGGEPVTPPEQALLEHVASQAGLVLRNLRLIDDLRGSRERLVTAQDVERRNLERDLQHGAQQSLVAVALLLRLATTRLGDDPDGVRPSVDEATTQLKQAIGELRELARGLHPAVLSERGLAPALASLAERSPVPVQIDSALAERLPDPVEATLYFAVAEALTNVAKYAVATTVLVTVRRDDDDDEVVVVVADDGIGGADASRGSGLRGLADRVAAVDGAVDVDSPPGAGTRLTCRVPLASVRTHELEMAR